MDEENDPTAYMPQLSPSASESESNQSSRPTTRLNSLRNTPNKKQPQKSITEKKKKPNIAKNNSADAPPTCGIGRSFKGAGFKIPRKANNALIKDEENLETRSSICSGTIKFICLTSNSNIFYRVIHQFHSKPATYTCH